MGADSLAENTPNAPKPQNPKSQIISIIYLGGKQENKSNCSEQRKHASRCSINMLARGVSKNHVSGLFPKLALLRNMQLGQ